MRALWFRDAVVLDKERALDVVATLLTHADEAARAGMATMAFALNDIALDLQELLAADGPE